MRVPTLMLVSSAFVLSAPVMADAPSTAASPPSTAAKSIQAASWQPRALKNFGTEGTASCDDLTQKVTSILLEFGARGSDLHVDQRGCIGTPEGATGFRSVNATFSVLVPTDKAENSAGGTLVEAQWQTVELRPGPSNIASLQLRPGPPDIPGCKYIEYVAQKVLPLFSFRDAKEVPSAMCDKIGVGLRAQVLKPAQQLAAAP
jgi:hypothetical protein